ncbi:MAG: response regulator [Actinomycetota bacterium]|nr:response regulator [Actinomycetota bacterium]
MVAPGAEQREPPDEVLLLVVEDDPLDAELVEGFARSVVTSDESITSVGTLAAAVGHLATARPDLVLLDLGLPDSQGSDTFFRLHADFPGLAIVVLTGASEVDLGARLVSAGAEDFLAKSDLSPDELRRVVRHAVERCRLRGRLEHLEQERQRNHELQFFGQLAEGDGAVAQQVYGGGPLEQMMPDLHRELSAEFARIVELRLDEDVFEVDRHSDARLRAIAEQMGFLHAGPRDTIALYSELLDDGSAQLSIDRATALQHEGRLALIQLMGFLLTYYRRYALAANRRGPVSREVSP